MSSDDAAFKAVYTNFKPIPSRKVVQITLEAPIEHGDTIIQMLGMPTPDDSKWVGVARLRPVSAPAKTAEKAPEAASTAPPVAGRERQRWDELGYPQRAGMLCDDQKFREYLSFKEPNAWQAFVEESDGDEGDAAARILRAWCKIESRSELARDMNARKEFDAIYASFRAWRDHGIA